MVTFCDVVGYSVAYSFVVLTLSFVVGVAVLRGSVVPNGFTLDAVEWISLVNGDVMKLGRVAMLDDTSITSVRLSFVSPQHDPKNVKYKLISKNILYGGALRLNFTISIFLGFYSIFQTHVLGILGTVSDIS